MTVLYRHRCSAVYYIRVPSITFFLLSSDIFITLRCGLVACIPNELTRFLFRIYAITFSNKILAVYFGSLALAKSATSLAALLGATLGFASYQDLSTQAEIDPIHFCGIITNVKSMWIPYSIGIVFGM